MLTCCVSSECWKDSLADLFDQMRFLKARIICRHNTFDICNRLQNNTFDVCNRLQNNTFDICNRLQHNTFDICNRLQNNMFDVCNRLQRAFPNFLTSEPFRKFFTQTIQFFHITCIPLYIYIYIYLYWHQQHFTMICKNIDNIMKFMNVIKLMPNGELG